MIIASATSDYILALVTAIASTAGSIAGIKIIVRHEMQMCEKRMEAFREGLKYSEKSD